MKQKQQRTLGKRVAYPWLGMGGLTLMGWFIGRVALAHTALAAPAPTVSSATPAALAQTADVVVQAFQATGAHATGYRVHGWAVVSRPSVQLAQLVAELEQENGVVSANISERMFTGEDGGQGCAASGLRSDGSRVWAIAAQTPGDAASQPGFSSSERPGASRQVTVAVEVDGPLTDADLPHPLAFQQAWGQLAASLATVADSPQIDGCIQGKRDARMSGGSEEGLADQAIHAVAAQVQERYHSADSASLSAYTPRVPLHVESNGHPVNIQVAWHDDTRRPQVDVWVGAPILTSTY